MLIKEVQVNFTDEEVTFLSLLDLEYSWPDYYKFRFICAQKNKDECISKIETISSVEKITITSSAKEHYFSITFRRIINSSTEVVDIYRVLSSIPDVIKI